MTDLLAGVDAKLRRGFDHLEELQREQRAFFATNPYVVVETTNPQTGWHHLTVRVDREPPVELGVIVGDAVGQFRSALDLLLTQASRLKKPEGGSLNFPICVERSAFSAAQRGGRSVEAVMRAGLRPEHVALVKRHQPFEQERETPNAMPLAALRYLSNVDKHEVVHAAYAVPRTSAISDVKDSIFHRPPVIENGTEIAAYLPDEDAATEIKAVVVISIAFGKDGRYREVDWGALHMIGAWVARIVEEFRVATPEFQPSPYPRPTTFMTPDELEEFRRSFVGHRARSEGRPYHEFSLEGERVFHLTPDCRVGRAIPVDRLRAGMGRPRLCSRCGRLPNGQAIDRAFVAGHRP